MGKLLAQSLGQAGKKHESFFLESGVVLFNSHLEKYADGAHEGGAVLRYDLL
jgi:hypothetical protein